MTVARRTFLHDIMEMAWGLFRAEQHGPDPRTFADALAGSWRWFKSRAARKASQPKWATSPRAAPVAFKSMLQSPIRRSLGGAAYANTTAACMGYLTSTLGR